MTDYGNYRQLREMIERQTVIDTYDFTLMSKLTMLLFKLKMYDIGTVTVPSKGYDIVSYIKRFGKMCARGKGPYNHPLGG